MTKTLPRARATPDVTFQRVETIVGMMRRGEWVPGRSGPQLANEWGLADDSLRHLAAEASRIVAREVTDPDRVKVDVSTVLLRDMHRASEAEEFGDVARLGDVVTRIVGARAPERHEVAVVVAQYEARGPREKATWLREKAAQLLAEADRLDIETDT